MNNMSTRVRQDAKLEQPDAPTFTCEVCKISVRSAQKLLDHVNFSPLHKAALEGGSIGGSRSTDRLGLSSNTSSHVAHHQRRVIYDGTKLFWRINETLELCIYEDAGANCVTITCFQQQSAEKIAPVLIDLRSLLKVLGLDDHTKASMHGSSHRSDGASSETLSKYLLARVQAKKDTRGHIALFLAKVHEHETLPALLTSSSLDQCHHYATQAHGMPTDLSVRRRHTMDDVKEAQKGVQDAAVELKKARVQAEHLSNLARISLDAFSKRGSMKLQQQPEQPASSSSPHGSSGTGSSSGTNGARASEWLRAYDRVSMKNAVEHSKGFLQALEKH